MHGVINVEDKEEGKGAVYGYPRYGSHGTQDV